MEIFTLVTGIIYIILEIRQSNWMWALGIVTGAAAVVVFWQQQLYASMGLNAYYVLMSVWGLYAWARDSRRLEEQEGVQAEVHLTRLTPRVALASLAMLVAGTVGLIALLKWLGDPMSSLDAGTAVLSAIATWWLSRSYKEQWLLWIVADSLATALCVSQAVGGETGMWWMALLYFAYTVSSFYGYIRWKRKGSYLE